MSLELALEKAYSAVVRANEAELAEVPFLLSMETTQEQIDKLPLPSVTLRATAHQEMVPNSGVYEVELTVEVADAAVRQDGPAIKLDAIFTHAVRPFLYVPLPAMISQAGASDQLQCFGLPDRGVSNGIEFGEGMVTRRKTALFICSCTV